jgi:phage gp29-like protein
MAKPTNNKRPENKMGALSAQPPKPHPPKNTKEIGDASLMFNGIIAGHEYNPKLQGTRRIQQYDEMRLGDAHVQASLKVVKLPLLSANWTIQPASEKREDRQIAEFVEQQLFNEPTRTWQETLTNILLHLDYGVMPFEKIWKFLDDGKIGLKKLAQRHPRTISRWEMKGGANGVEQTTTNGVFQIPMEKLIIFVNEKEGDNWEGKSILRSAWKHWLFKDKAELIEIMAMERHGLGVPYGKTGTNATPEEEAKLDEILRNFRANAEGFLRFPNDFEVGMLDMKSNSIKNPNDFIKRQEWAIMLNVLATFMQMGSGSVGSFALFKGSNTFFLMALEYVAKHVAQTINKYLIEDLVNFNFVTDKYPTLIYDKIGTVDVNALTTALQRGIQTGVLTVDSHLEDYLRDAMDLPEFTGEVTSDPAMADGMLAELDSDVESMVASLDDEDEVLDESLDEEEPTDEEIEEAVAAFRNGKTPNTFKFTYGEGMYKFMKTLKMAKGVPLSDEHKKKISEALKKLQAKGGKKLNAPKKKAKGKAANPALTKKRAEVKALREEARAFNAQVRRELLEAKAKGIKLDPQAQAKKELDIFNRKEEISAKIRKVQDEIEEIKEKAKPPAKATPAKKEASHHHEPEATPDSLLDMFEAVEAELATIRKS